MKYKKLNLKVYCKDCKFNGGMLNSGSGWPYCGYVDHINDEGNEYTGISRNMYENAGCKIHKIDRNEDGECKFYKPNSLKKIWDFITWCILEHKR